MANFRPRCSVPISSRMSGNFCTVDMMIFFPDWMNWRRSPECSAWPTVAPTCANCLMVSRICWSRMRRSVMTMMELKIGAPSHGAADELVREPGDGIRFAASRGVLDQVPLPCSGLLRIREELPHHVELVVSRENLIPLLLAGFLVLPFDDLGVVLEDVGETVRGEKALPKVVCFESLRDSADSRRRRSSPD